VDAAAMVKMAQNVMIGLVAFLMAIWATMSLDRKDDPTAEKPPFMEVWWRFPKFVVGFMVASLVVSFLVEPVWGGKAVKAVSGMCKSYRSWFFALCFVAGAVKPLRPSAECARATAAGFSPSVLWQSDWKQILKSWCRWAADGQLPLTGFPRPLMQSGRCLLPGFSGLARSSHRLFYPINP
jgi:hypothetical protein